MKTTHRNNYTTLKTFTLILVVFAHITRMYTGYGAISMPKNSILTYVTEFIYLFHMPLFMFLSGAIYKSCINAGKYNKFGSFILTKIKRLAVPFIVFGLFYVAPVMLLLKITAMSPIEYIVKGLLLGKDTRHLWFLYSLFQFFVVIQLLKPTLQKWNCAKYILFIGSVLLYLANGHVYSWLGMKHFFTYFCFFVAGYIFEDLRDSLQGYLDKFWYCGFILFLIMGIIFSSFSGIICSLLCAFLGIAACILLSGHFSEPLKNIALFQSIQGTSMGIYLFHPMLIYIMFYFIQDMNINAYVITGACFILVMIFSHYLTKLFRKLGLKALLGE